MVVLPRSRMKTVTSPWEQLTSIPCGTVVVLHPLSLCGISTELSVACIPRNLHSNEYMVVILSDADASP